MKQLTHTFFSIVPPYVLIVGTVGVFVFSSLMQLLQKVQG